MANVYGDRVGIWTEGWFRADGTKPNAADIYTDGWYQVAGDLQNLTDTEAITDSLSKTSGVVRAIADTIVSTDVFSKISTVIRKITTSQTVTDVVTRFLDIIYKITNTQIIIDTVVRTVTWVREIVDTINPSTARGRYKSFADTQSITDSLSIGEDIGDAVAIWLEGWFKSDETLPGSTYIYTDGWWETTLIGQFASISDTLGITDFVSRSALTFVVFIEDILDGITTTVSKAKVLLVDILDTLNITDSLAEIGVFIRKITDTETIVSFGKSVVDYVITITDNLVAGITDTIDATSAIIVEILDSLGITDALTRVHTAIRKITDIEAITDSIDTARLKLIEIADALGITDILLRTGGFIRLITDPEAITDTSSRIVEWFREILNTMVVSDALTVGFEGARFITIATIEAVTDSITRAGAFIMAIADSIGITDSVTKIAIGFKRLIVNISVSLATVNIETKGFFISLTDTIVSSTILVRTASIIRTIISRIGITDLIAYLKFRISRPKVIHIPAISIKTVHFTAVSDKTLHLDAKSSKAVHYTVE